MMFSIFIKPIQAIPPEMAFSMAFNQIAILVKNSDEGIKANLIPKGYF
jgi:hypothetical protein